MGKAGMILEIGAIEAFPPLGRKAAVLAEYRILPHWPGPSLVNGTPAHGRRAVQSVFFHRLCAR